MLIRNEAQVPANRRGLSLLEVLIALTIFMMGMIAIGRLMTMAGERALAVKLEGQATQLCQAKLAEVVSGAVPLSAQSDMAFDEDPDWHWSLEANQDGANGLWHLKVKVSRDQPGGSKIECAISQFMLDPSLRGSTLDVAQTPIGSKSTSPAGSGSGSSASSGGSGAGNASGGAGAGKAAGGTGGGKAVGGAGSGAPAGGKAPAPSAGGKGKGGS